MAFAAARLAGRFVMSRGARRAAAYSARQAYRAAARAMSRAGRYAKVTARRNPMSAGFLAGGVAENLYRGAKKRNLKSIRQGRIVKPRKAGPGPVPSAPSSRVSAQYAVAPRMTKFRKAAVHQQKVPKSTITHYKEFGQFNAEKVMFINHEHWGSSDKFWYGISLALAKKLLAYAKIYPVKSFEEQLVGPRTSITSPDQQLDEKSGPTVLRLCFISEQVNGNQSRQIRDVNIDDNTASPDVYRTLDSIAQEISGILQDRYDETRPVWLHEASIVSGNEMRATEAYIQNLDDAEICLYANSLIKFQNVTPADHFSTVAEGKDSGYDRQAIDANPLTGRIYTAKGHHPLIDTDLAQMGDTTLADFFSDVSDTTGGITVLGHANTYTADDLGRISHLPQAKELYGNQSVRSGMINMAAGAMKFHKTTYRFKKTFKQLAYMSMPSEQPDLFSRIITSHTLFGFKCAHKHGEDSIKIGYNRDIDVGCYIKHKRVVHPLKNQITRDNGATNVATAPTEHGHPT